MAKKNKRNIQALIAKRAALQSLNQKPLVAIPGAPKSPPRLELAASEAAPVAALPAYKPGREIWHTLLATAVIAVVLTALIVIDRRSPYLTEFGDTIYRALELGN